MRAPDRFQHGRGNFARVRALFLPMQVLGTDSDVMTGKRLDDSLTALEGELHSLVPFAVAGGLVVAGLLVLRRARREKRSGTAIVDWKLR